MNKIYRLGVILFYNKQAESGKSITDRGKRQAGSCFYLPSESGKISPGISE